MLFVVTPPLDTSLIPSAFDSFQILIPCQGPSVCSNDAKLVHLTAHSGYTIKVPSNILHNHQGAIRSIGRIFSPVVQGASMASAVSGGPRIPTSSLTSGMTETLRLLGNRNLSDIVGLSLQDMYRVQSLVDSHQQIAMKYLLLSALTDNNQNTTGDLSRLSVYNANGHKFVWVCAECRALLLNGKHIDRSHHTTVEDYKELSKHEKEINVVLKDFVSAKVLTEAIRNSAVAEKVVVRVLPGYFEQRDRRETDPTVFNSICRQFSGLGKALQERPLLTSLEIRCNTITGQLYEGFDQILKCSTLEYLTVIGVPLLLQKDKLLIDCKKLKRLVLDGVLVNTEASAANLAKLIGNATILKALCVSRAAFTPPSLNGLFVDRHQKMQRQLRKLEELALPRNDLDDYGAEKFVSFALKGNSLKALDLRENPSITNDGYQQILECLARQTRQITFDCRE
ncbi:hypothetical protein BX616_009827 [Lobosporangium transversale]|nr:hypothetical protein BX616_009827 [Lobosporangium transversale]